MVVRINVKITARKTYTFLGEEMIFKIKTNNLIKTIDTDDFIEKDIDVILDSEIYYLRKEERNMFGTTSAIVEVEEQK